MKCVCVMQFDWSNALGNAHEGKPLPVKGQVYTIFEVEENPWVKSQMILILEEIGTTAGFAIEGFRPIVTKTQEEDVEVFRKLVIGAPELIE